MPSIGRLIASTCSATISWKRSSGSCWKKRDTLHGEIRAVHLQHEAARVDQRVLLPHLAGEGHDVALVGAVVRVEQDGRLMPGDAAVMKRSTNFLGCASVPRWKSSHSAWPVAEVGVLDLGDGLGRVPMRAASRRRRASISA